ncbi:MAG: HD domain-containing protein [Planctomycetaceae bacterium]|nr:HD domain-containing protein [Planctomycetaceae bacterium]
MNKFVPTQRAANRAGLVQPEVVSVGIDDLALGRELKFPIYDRNGLLLLAEGSIVTSVFRERLRERAIVRVRMHAEDAFSEEDSRNPSGELPRKTSAPHDEQISALMKQTLKQGLQFVTNSGTAAMQSRVYHGDSPYDSARKTRIQKQCQHQQEKLASLMPLGNTPERVDATCLRELTHDLLLQFCEDFDCVNATAMSLAGQTDLIHHCYRMAVLGMSIAIEMGLNDENVCRIGMTGLLHDWGMLKIPAEIRDPARPLSEREQLELQKHVIHSLNMLEKISELPSLVSLVSYQVHERMDGAGYPRGRKGNGIHLFARILHVAHLYVELTSPRQYRAALTPYEATLELLGQARQGAMDPVVLRAFLRSQSLFPTGSMVQLSTGRKARVLRSNGDSYTQPIVQMVEDERGRPHSAEKQPEIVNLMEADCTIVKALPILHGPEPIPAPHFLKTNSALKTLHRQELASLGRD